MTKRIIAVLCLMAGIVSAETFQNVKQNAEKALRSNMYSNAIEDYTSFLQSKGIAKYDKFRTYIELSDIYLYRMNKPEKALSYLEKAKTLFSPYYREMDKVLYRMGLCYERLGKFQEAAEMYQDIVVKFRKSKFYNDAWKRVSVAFARNYKDTVAYVGGEYITSMELDNMLDRLNPMAKKYYSSPAGRNKLLERLIEQKLLAKEAESQKLFLDSDVQNQIKNCRENALMRALVTRVIDSVRVPLADMQKYYSKNIKRFTEKAEVRAQKIALKSKDSAKHIYKLIKQGQNFDTLKAKYSITNDAKNNSSFYIYKTSKPENLVKTVFRLKKGAISNPIKINDSTYYIVKVLDKKDKKVKKFDEVEKLIENSLKQGYQKKAYDKLILSLKKKYEVKVYSNNSEGNQKPKTKEKK